MGRNILEDVFPGESTMAARMRTHDWASTPLGPPQQWAEGLRVPLGMMLTSRFEMWLGWGEDLTFFYNDAYAPTLGVKHPSALGQPLRIVWQEIFSQVEGRLNSVMRDGVATWDEALLLILERSGVPEETYHTFSYSPLRGHSATIDGVMCVVSEQTERVISERRLATLQVLASALLSVGTRGDVIDAVRRALQTNTRDFPFAALLIGGTDDTDSDPIASAPWPLDAITPGVTELRVDLQEILPSPPTGAWDIPPRDALLLPVARAGQSDAAAILILGLNPLRHRDDDVGGFAKLLVAQIAGALGTVDARARESAETERLRQLFEQSPSFMALLRGSDHRFELVNPGYLQLIGHRDVVGKPVRTALPEIVEQGLLELLDRVFTTGEPFIGKSLPVLLQREPQAELEERFLDFVYQPITNSDGEITGIFAEGFDVTASHEAANALRESEAQFRTLAEAMRNHAWTARPDGYLDWFNAQVYAYSGAEIGSLDGSGWASLLHPDDVASAESRWAASLISGEPYDADFRLRNDKGEYRWHIARAVAQRSEDGSILRWVGTNTDIHEQITATQALADLNATLEHQVKERTSDLMAAEEALRQSQKMEAVGQLTGGIAHDFNNLLAVVSGNLELLEKRIGDGRFDAVPRYVDAAQNAARRAASLTQRLLAFSRRQTLDPKPVNLNRLTGEMEGLIRQTIGPAIEMEVVGAGGLWLTLVDPNQLENALLNLCINARDAMPDGGRVTIETANKWLDDRAARERELPAGQYVSLCVTDTGTGMSPDVIARAFDPFFTTKPLGQGTGLGLSMIYGFVRQSGGQVRIYSEQGQGTTMCLYLPRYSGSEGKDEDRNAEASQDYIGHGETVLIVDDEAAIRSLIVDLLNGSGYHTIEAEDGMAGLKLLQSDRRIDLLITDVGLPGGMNGRQVADAGRALRPGLKVLFITGYAENAVVGNGHLDRGMQVMTKPFAIEPLGNKIREMLDN